jgi:cysteine desulfurase
MPAPRVYCDYNATAPLRPEARAAMAEALESAGNPSSVHAEGRSARARIERSRDVVAETIGSCRDDIAFTSGGTEAVGAAILGAREADPSIGVVASAIEHDAVMSLCLMPGGGPAHADGRVDLAWLKEAATWVRDEGFRPLISLMLVNNETGVIQPVADAAEIAHQLGGLIHCDAIQALGKIPVSVVDLEVDYLSVSAHKLGGPQGVGAVYVKPGAPFLSVQTGGGQELGRRAGTENVAGVAGFAAACEAAIEDFAVYAGLAKHRDAMEAKLQAAANVIVHGQTAPRVAGVSCFGLSGLASETQVMNLDLAGIAVSAGSACSSGKVKPSRVLTAMGLDEDLARSSLRASFGWSSKPEDFDALADAWLKMVRRMRPAALKEAAHVAG